MATACGVGQANAGFHQRVGALALVAALEIGQLQRAVHAEHFGVVDGRHGHHCHALGHGHGHNVGEVVLLLHVIVLQRHHRALEPGGGSRQHAGVDLADLALAVAGVFVFHDGFDGTSLAHDAAVAGGVVEFDGQQGQLIALAGRGEGGGGFGANQGHIAVEHEGCAGIAECRHGLLDGVARAELRLLAHEVQAPIGACGLHALGAMPGNDHGAISVEPCTSLQNVVQ
jgi:hypothetical protein